MSEQWVQIVDSLINLIGSEEKGLPLPAEYLKDNPHVQNILLSEFDEEPGIYDKVEIIEDVGLQTKEIIVTPYQVWKQKEQEEFMQKLNESK